MRMTNNYIFCISGVLMLLLLIQCNNDSPASVSGPTELEGSWKQTIAGQNVIFIFSSQKIYFVDDGNLSVGGTFTTNNRTTPKQIDVFITDYGSYPAYVGKISCGVYSLDGNNLRMAMGKPGGERADFGSDGAEVFDFVKQ